MTKEQADSMWQAVQGLVNATRAQTEAIKKQTEAMQSVDATLSAIEDILAEQFLPAAAGVRP